MDDASPLSRLYWLTNERVFQSQSHFFDQVEYALQQGLGWLQYRNKDPAPHSMDLLSALQKLCAVYGTRLMMNDHLALASQLQCGLHLGAEDCPVSTARRLLPSALIGVSCYQDLSRAIELQPLCDYVAFGAFYPSTTKPNAACATLPFLVQAREKLECPIVVIGGITPANLRPLLQAGADIIAVSAALNDCSQFKKTLTLFADQLLAI